MWLITKNRLKNSSKRVSRRPAGELHDWVEPNAGGDWAHARCQRACGYFIGAFRHSPGLVVVRRWRVIASLNRGRYVLVCLQGGLVPDAPARHIDIIESRVVVWGLTIRYRDDSWLPHSPCRAQ